MVQEMEKVAKNMTDSTELGVEERNLLSVAYKARGARPAAAALAPPLRRGEGASTPWGRGAAAAARAPRAEDPRGTAEGG